MANLLPQNKDEAVLSCVPDGGRDGGGDDECSLKSTQ